MASYQSLYELVVEVEIGTIREGVDCRATGESHEFYTKHDEGLAAVVCRNEDGNPAPGPHDHKSDDSLRRVMLDRLSRLDVEQPAYIVLVAVEEGDVKDLTACKGIVYSWIATRKANH